ncbi:MAG: EscU/YscU/HrcU family type III secretion system export apparatus switch protein [Bacillota bacterium]
MNKKKAVALKYAAGDKAPRVIALGKGEIAEKIIKIANNRGVPIMEKPVLVEQLVKVEINQEIPSELYEAVAEILAFLYSLNKKDG